MNTLSEILINGQPGGTVPPQDRGLAYGDGLFETLAVSAGKPVLWDAHLARLDAGCVRLGLPAPDPDALAAEADRLCYGRERAVLKILYTRGNGGRGYSVPVPAEPLRVLSVHAWPAWPAPWREQGVRIRLCQTRLARQPALAGMKHLNRLEQVLARQEWDDPDIAEGLLCDDRGHVIEGVVSNLFIVQAGRLLTPDLSECGVAGIMRAYLLARSQTLGIPTAVQALRPETLYEAEEVLLCNSVIGIWPVRQLGDAMWPVGPVTQQLRTRVEEELRI